jgi:hypothetical protein
MVSSTCIHVVTTGDISAAVHQSKARDGSRDFNVVVEGGCQGNNAFFHVSQLPSLREVLEQVELFIRHREQLARMSCPSCGETPFRG